ncbi:MAG: MFS transporter [Chloroflexota bacterium]|nr:MFS transporter [Chloroflexota bacterium]
MTVENPNAQSHPDTGLGISPVFALASNRNYRLMWGVGFSAGPARRRAVRPPPPAPPGLTNSVFLTQLAGVSFLLPQVFMGIFSGLVADAFDRRKVVLVTFIMDFLLFGCLTALLFLGLANEMVVLGISFLVGISFNLDMVARRTMVIDIVGKDLLTTAVPLDNLNMTIGSLSGPVIAGVALKLFSEEHYYNVALIYMLIATLYLVAIFFLLKIRIKPTNQDNSFDLRGSYRFVAEGFREVLSDKAIVGVLGITVLMNVSFFSFKPMIPVFAEKVLYVDPVAMGLLAGASGLGSLFGSIFIAAKRNIRSKSAYYSGGTLLSLGLLFLFSFSRNYPASLILQVLSGVSTAAFGAMQATLILLYAKEEMRGRAMGILSLAIGAEPIGGILLGVLAEILDPGSAVGLVTGTGLVLTVGWVIVAKEMRRL